MNLRSSLAALALFAFAQVGQAITLNKEITLADGRGGQMVAVTTGELGAAGATRSTDATFSNFQPREDGGRVNGSLRREFSREGRETESVLSGRLTLTPAAGAANSAVRVLEINNLIVVRDGEGPEVSGSVSVDGQAIPAERLPATIRKLLRRLAGLTQL
jgi:hypothetical protein